MIEQALKNARVALDDIEKAINTHNQELESIIDELQKERDEALRRIVELEQKNEDLRWELMALQEE